MEIMLFQQFGFPVDKKCRTHVQVEMGEPIDLKREDKKMVSTLYTAQFSFGFLKFTMDPESLRQRK